jgi:hypothetical protein
MSGRPFLSLFHSASTSHEIVKRTGNGLALAFDTNDQLDSLVPAISEGIERLAANPKAFGAPDPSAYAEFTAKAVAGRFAQVFDSVSR